MSENQLSSSEGSIYCCKMKFLTPGDNISNRETGGMQLKLGELAGLISTSMIEDVAFLESQIKTELPKTFSPHC